MPVRRRPARGAPSLPLPLDIQRKPRKDRLPLLEVFRGLDRIPAFGRYPGTATRVRRAAKETFAHVSNGPGWMYVAPRATPPEVKAAGFEMVTSEEDEIVIAREYLTKGPAIDLYLDIIHEFLHILQRRTGRELWPGMTVAYVDRPTEIEAYAFSVDEARRLGLSDAYLRRYLRVMWVTNRDHLRLLRHLGVAPPRKRPKRRATP